MRGSIFINLENSIRKLSWKKREESIAEYVSDMVRLYPGDHKDVRNFILFGLKVGIVGNGCTQLTDKQKMLIDIVCENISDNEPRESIYRITLDPISERAYGALDQMMAFGIKLCSLFFRFILCIACYDGNKCSDELAERLENAFAPVLTVELLESEMKSAAKPEKKNVALREEKVKITKLESRILNVFANGSGLYSAEEVCDELGITGGSEIEAAIRHMCELNILNPVENPLFAGKYELSDINVEVTVSKSLDSKINPDSSEIIMLEEIEPLYDKMMGKFNKASQKFERLKNEYFDLKDKYDQLSSEYENEQKNYDGNVRRLNDNCRIEVASIEREYENLSNQLDRYSEKCRLAEEELDETFALNFGKKKSLTNHIEEARDNIAETKSLLYALVEKKESTINSCNESIIALNDKIRILAENCEDYANRINNVVNDVNDAQRDLEQQEREVNLFKEKYGEDIGERLERYKEKREKNEILEEKRKKEKEEEERKAKRSRTQIEMEEVIMPLVLETLLEVGRPITTTDFYNLTEISRHVCESGERITMSKVSAALYKLLEQDKVVKVTEKGKTFWAANFD